MERPQDTSSSKEQTLLINEDGTSIESLQSQVNALNELVGGIVTAPIIAPVPQAVNFLRNGSYAHSVQSWFNDGASNDERYECAWWYSAPVVDGQPMYIQTTKDGSVSVSFATTDVDTSADTIAVGNKIPTGTGITFTVSAGSLPSPLAISTVYYAINYSSTKIQVATSLVNALAGTFINLTTVGVTGPFGMVFNYTLKSSSDTEYSSVFSDWERSLGLARPEGSYDISCPVPGTIIDPAYTYYASFSIVRANQYVVCPTGARINAGLYAHSTARGWEWVSGDFLPSATVVGTVLTPTSRDYVVHCITDRGFTIQSTALTVASAPSDTDFAGGSRVVLTWPQVLNYGVSSYDIYRKTGATYKFLKSITTGQLTYIDNNVSTPASGYPSFTFNRLVAFTASQEVLLPSIPYAGDPQNPQWPTTFYAIKTPQNYDKSDTILADGQWLRFYLSGLTGGRLDMQVTDGVCNTTTTVTSAAGQFTTSQTGLTVTITDGTHTDTRTMTYVSATQITLNTASSFSATGCTVTVSGGAPAHSLYIDLCHLDSQQGAAFSWNPEDFSSARGIPASNPNGSSQGGNGGGGGSGSDGGGVIRCVDEDEVITTVEGEITGRELHDGFWHDEEIWLSSPDGPNRVVDASAAAAEVWRIECENGTVLRASGTKQVYVSDEDKVLMSRLKVGDTVMTMIGASKIVSKDSLGTRVVIQISLTPNHKFYAGGVLVNNLKELTQ